MIRFSHIKKPFYGTFKYLLSLSLLLFSFQVLAIDCSDIGESKKIIKPGSIKAPILLEIEGTPLYAEYFTIVNGVTQWVGRYESSPRGDVHANPEILVHENFLGLGISTYMFSEALKAQGDVKFISGQYYNSGNSTNFQVFAKALKNTRDIHKALKATPGYKSISKFGFTKVSELKKSEDLILFTLEKEDL